jgi:RNA polymerase sigma factor for flagellar operon FliA
VSTEAQQIVDLADAAVAGPALSRTDTATTSSPTDQNHLKDAALKAYASQTRKLRRDKLIIEFLPMVRGIVHQIASFLRPPLSKEDLISAGTIGLVKAARDFDSSRDVEFKTYAYIRIKGAVLDELRGWSFAPAAAKKQLDRAHQIVGEAIAETGTAPSDRALAEKLDIPVEKMYRMFAEARARHFLSIHGMSDEAPALGSMLAAGGTEQPGDSLQQSELVAELTNQISQLPQKQRRIIVLYYHKHLTMKQIAAVLKVTESRVSQLHASALFRLSVRLRKFDDTRQ